MTHTAANTDTAMSYLNLLKDIAIAANEAATSRDALVASLRSVCETTRWPVGHVLLSTASCQLESAQIWHVADDAGLGQGFDVFRTETEARSFSAGEGLPGRVLANGSPAWIADADKDCNYVRRDLARNANLTSSFAFPIHIGTEVVAVLEFFAIERRPPSAELLDVMTHVGVQLGRVFERQAADNAIAAHNRRNQQILDSAGDAFIGMDANGRVTAWNRAAEDVFGWPRTAILGRSLTETIVAEQYRGAHAQGLKRFLDTEVPRVLGQHLELPAIHQDGHEFPIEITLWSLRTDNQWSFYAFARDITARKAAERDLKHRALHDTLTGLPNRALLSDRLAQQLARRDIGRLGLAVLFIDLDHFKRVNDSFGHEAGDQVLNEVADRLQRCLRPADTAGRLSGDEFLVICPEVSKPRDAVIIAQRLLAELISPIRLKDDSVFLSASIGVAFAEADSDPDSLIGAADIAMYEAKSSGRAHYELFDQRMQIQVASRLRIESELRNALDQGQLRLHFQPIVSATDASVVALEALLRWQHPQRGLLLPGEFMHIAEETGLIVPIGAWVLEEACRQARHWALEHRADLPLWVSVNLSGRQLAQADLVAMVERTLASAAIDPSRIQFGLEITETVVMRDPEAAAETLRALRQLGVHLSIDDFGTGYSSLSYLKRFPIDTVKVDLSFVTGIAEDKSDQAIVDAVTRLAHVLGLSVVAEGVETQAQAEALARIGVDYLQGYRYARPQAPEHIGNMLRASSLDPSQ